MNRCDDNNLARMIYLLAHDMRNLAEKILAPYGLTLEQLQTLKVLSPAKGVTQRQLGAEIKKNPANLTRILDRLENKSLVIRRSDPEDRRAYRIFLTEKGSVTAQEVKNIFEVFSAGLQQGLTNEMKRTTTQVLQIIAANVEKMSSTHQQSE